MKQLAAEFGVHHHTISKHLEARAVPHRGGKPPFAQDDLPVPIKQYNAGDSCVTIADRYGVDPATVLRWLKKTDVQMRPRRGGRATDLNERST